MTSIYDMAQQQALIESRDPYSRVCVQLEHLKHGLLSMPVGSTVTIDLESLRLSQDGCKGKFKNEVHFAGTMAEIYSCDLNIRPKSDDSAEFLFTKKSATKLDRVRLTKPTEAIAFTSPEDDSWRNETVTFEERELVVGVWESASRPEYTRPSSPEQFRKEYMTDFSSTHTEIAKAVSDSFSAAARKSAAADAFKYATTGPKMFKHGDMGETGVGRIKRALDIKSSGDTIRGARIAKARIIVDEFGDERFVNTEAREMELFEEMLNSETILNPSYGSWS